MGNGSTNVGQDRRCAGLEGIHAKAFLLLGYSDVPLPDPQRPVA